MTKLGRAIDFDVTRKPSVFTWGLQIPFLTNYIANKTLGKIEKIFDNQVAYDAEFENARILHNLILKQILYRGLCTIFENAGYDSKEYKEAEVDFKAIFFRDFKLDGDLEWMYKKIDQLDSKIEMLVGVVDSEKDDGVGLFTVVAWVEDVLHREMRPDMSLRLFAKYYERALLIHKKQDDGKSNK